MSMPFGKYKGQEISAIPDEYLLWLVSNIPLREPLLSDVVEELTSRELEFAIAPPAPLPSPPPRQAFQRQPAKSSSEDDDGGGAWTMGGDPQELIRGDFPMSSRVRNRE
jgi:hypothetical protein